MITPTKIQEAPKLGEGVFLTRDVADILKLPYHKVQYLMNSFWSTYTFGAEKNKAINFFALIEFYTYYHLRTQKISSINIKKFHSRLSKILNTPYPFASVEIKTQQNQIWYEYMGFLMKGDGKQQPSIKTFIEPFLKKIEFGNDMLAKRFFPLEKSKIIVVDPKHQFGQPTITGTNIRVDVIRKLHDGGESKKNICILYDLKARQIDDALLYYKRTG